VTRPLNLLNYPSLARQRKVFHYWWTGLAGLFLGSALAWAWQQWLVQETVRLQQEQSHLQAALAAHTRLAQEIRRQQTYMRRQAEYAGHLKQIAEHQAVWKALHEALQQEAVNRGLRLTRLQMEAERIELQGTMAHFEAMTDARQSLSVELTQTFALTRMAMGPSGEVNFVWQTMAPAPSIASSAAAQARLWTSPARATPTQP
jgi:glycerol uptake facilitator-like aquaporin